MLHAPGAIIRNRCRSFIMENVNYEFLACLTNNIMKQITITHKSIMKLGATKNHKAWQAAKKSRIPFKEQQTTQIILNNIVRELEVHKTNNHGGRMP